MTKLAKLMTVLAAAVGFVVFFGPWSIAHAGTKSDFALFDGTNPLNLDAAGKTGAICGMTNKSGDELKPLKSFVYYVTVTVDDAVVDREIKVVYTDGDFVRYKLTNDQSFSMSQAGGSGVFDAAIRVVADKNVSGSVSIQGKKSFFNRVFCVSCDELADGDAFCDTIIPTP